MLELLLELLRLVGCQTSLDNSDSVSHNNLSDPTSWEQRLMRSRDKA